jgi:hypothetical protein
MRGSARLRLSPELLLVVAAAGSAALLVAWQANLTFLIDDWDLLLYRRGLSVDAILEPHNEHIIAGPALAYKAIQVLFGMDSLLPYAVASTAAFIAGVVLLYEYLRRRIEAWLALGAVLLLLFMGAA